MWINKLIKGRLSVIIKNRDYKLIYKQMDKNLLKIRFVSFGWGVFSLIVLAIVGVLSSPAFKELVLTNFGSSVWTGFLFLLLPELVKHLRNLAEIKKLGGLEDKKIFLI